MEQQDQLIYQVEAPAGDVFALNIPEDGIYLKMEFL
jgi:hypothetical protein